MAMLIKGLNKGKLQNKVTKVINQNTLQQFQLFPERDVQVVLYKKTHNQRIRAGFEPLCLCNPHRLSWSISLCLLKLHRTKPKSTQLLTSPCSRRRVVKSPGHRQEGPSMDGSSSIQLVKRNLPIRPRRGSPPWHLTHSLGHQAASFSPAQGISSTLSRQQKLSGSFNLKDGKPSMILRT